ncbi:N-glycosylase/DNA lyase [Infirmifilum uzonense]|uniref:N-glycosylase/DNA lyase n=1 Tax=Infirmifilum uzonense TaxID=1550241 RepID=UPI003C756C4A
MFFPDEEKAKVIGVSLSEPLLAEAFVKVDPQYESVSEIVRKMGYVEGSLYVIGVALISYMLSSRGEEHWRIASKYAEGGCIKALQEFVTKSPSINWLRDQRKKRVELYVSKALPSLREQLQKNEVDLDTIHLELARLLKARKEDKTVVFAIKMLYYSLLSSGKGFHGGIDIPIPVDYRVSLVSFTSGLFRGWSCGEDLRRLAREARTRQKETIIRLWKIVAEVAGKPPFLLDSIVWVTGRCIDEYLSNPGLIERCLWEKYGISEYHTRSVRILWSTLEECLG